MIIRSFHFVPLSPLANLEVLRVTVFGIEAGIGQYDHLARLRLLVIMPYEVFEDALEDGVVMVSWTTDRTVRSSEVLSWL